MGSEYDYSLDECDVPEVRKKSLNGYRNFRKKCLEYLVGSSETSVMNQVHNLAWYTVVFRTLNEARRIEQERKVNGALWELVTAGYGGLLTMGIRKLVDKDPRTDSLCNVIDLIKKRPELFTREKFICYDGLPYDYALAQKNYYQKFTHEELSKPHWLATKGPEAWAVSEMMHRAFDKLSGNPNKRKREDKILSSTLDKLVEQLNHPAIVKVCNMVNQQIAHAERLTDGAKLSNEVTYNDINDAFKQVVQVANFLLESFFCDVALGSIVPTPQIDVLEALDAPWVNTENLSLLQEYWQQQSIEMDGWIRNN
ncbi:MAG: hypothetical protein SFU55_04720 [Methylophilus sp.]|nr:hypothetical protein [Methylophilus sp.]